MERRISLKTDKTKITHQTEYNRDLTEEQLTKLLQDAYEEEIPTLSEELLQKTLEKAKATEQETEEQSSVQPSFVRQWIGKVVVKRCVVVTAMCMLLFVCGKIVQEGGAFVQKSAAPEMWDTESAKNETSSGMYFNGAAGTDIGMMADSTQSFTEEAGVTNEECAERFPQAETETTDDFVAEQSEQESVDDESIYESLLGLLPMFPHELYETEASYALWRDGVQVKSGWESYLEYALRHSPMESLALQKEEMDGMTEVDTLPADTFFSEKDVLFTLMVSSENINYCIEVGACTKVTIEQNGEKRSAFFTILDLTLYEEILTINL